MFKIFLLFTICLTLHTVAGEEKQRRPKLFFISTSSTTSTLSTLSVCYTTNAALSACGRKKRALDSIMSSGDAVEEELRRMAPSQTQRLEEEEEIEEDGEKFEEGELDSGVEEVARDGKFLLYWKTTTLTSTSTTYTVTHSLKKLECTPSGFDLAACG